jgi:outer membrane lipoprotein-sorting protein
LRDSSSPRLFLPDLDAPIASTSIPSAQELLSKLEARRKTLTSLRGLARIVYKDTNEKGTAKQAIAVASPDRFRWELFSPIGVAALVTSDGARLATYFPNEKILYRGPATAENVARFTRVFLSPREIVGLLLGAPVLPSTKEGCTVRLDTDYNWSQLSCRSAGQEGVDLWFDPRTSQLRRAAMYAADGSVAKRMDLSDYRPVGNNTFPFEIVLFDLQNQQQASIYYERVELNPHPVDAIFTLASINGVREVDAEAFTP